MPAQAGREITVSWNGEILAGVRTKTITISGEPIDITNDDDDGVRKLLNDAASQDQIDVAITGVLVDDVLRQDFFTGGASREREVIVTFADGATITFNARLTEHVITGEYQGEATFDATLQSTGAFTYGSA